MLRLVDIIFSAQRGALMLLRVIAMLQAEDFRSHQKRCFLSNADLSRAISALHEINISKKQHLSFGTTSS